MSVELKVKRSYAIPENEMVIIKDTNTLLHNIVDIEVKEKDKEIERLKKENKELGRDYSRANNEFLRLHSIIKEVREYITSYESISTIQGLNNLEVLNDGLDYKTIEEMTNRYLKVHDKILEILDKENI